MFVFFFCSCNQEQKPDNLALKGVIYDSTKVDTIHIDVEEIERRIEENHLVKENVEIIPLETKEECLVGEINKLHFDGERFYVFDRHIAKKLFVFDKNGKFLFQIGKQGKGPSEYSSINDIMVYPHKNQVDLLDLGAHKILRFNSKTGEFIEERHYNEVLFPKGMAYVEDKNLVFYGGSYMGPEYFEHIPELEELDIRYNLLVMNQDFLNIDQKAYAYDDIGYFKGRTIATFSVFSGFYYYNDTLTFAPTIENYISRITSEGVFARYFIDFGKSAVPNDFWKEDYKLTSLKQTEYISFIERVFETQNYLCFTLGFRGSRLRLLYSKKHKKVFQGFDIDDTKENYVYFGELLGTYNGKIMSEINSLWGSYCKLP